MKEETPERTTDHELLARYVTGGSEAAFREIVGRYAGLVYGTARRIVEDSGEAEDVCQAVFLVLARNARTL